MNRFLILCGLLCITLISQAQYDPSRIPAKAREAYEKALVKIDQEKWDDALESLQEAIRREPRYLEAYVSLAGVYSELKDRRKSIENYERAFAIDTAYLTDIRLAYAIALAGEGQFSKALDAVNRLLALPRVSNNTRKAAEYRRKSFQFAVDFAQSHPDNYVFNPRNLGPGINSAEPEYFPSLTIDGNDMIFTRRLGGRNEDFFLSHREGGKWGPAYHLNGAINTPQNEGAQNVSQDGNWLIFTGCHRPDGAGSCDLYISYRQREGWSAPVNMGPVLNTDQWETQPCLSPDKKDLYFVSRRFGGLGGSDIYVSHQLPNGRWSEPENLGPEINTPGDELTPFIHADNQTLYFASNGLPGYGNQDLYVVRRGADGKWGKPQNLGYPINTIDEESTLAIASDGVTAYYASDRAGGFGSMDIYSFDMRPSMQPVRTLWVRGNVYDSKTRNGLPSSLSLVDLATRQEVSRVQTDEKGDYLITLPIGKDYLFNVNRRGYLFYSDHYFLRDKTPDSTYRKDIPLVPIEVNAAVVLRNVFFDVNKFELKPESQVELDRVVQLLQDNPTVRIQLEGHTDNQGVAADNQKLSDNRAKAVVNYLLSKGIRSDRLVAKGFGAAHPVADNATEEGRAQNRRTELKVIAK
ncbi:flagellar motor protein MotB [Flaviaesturariibacter flavus]|uniref:Flagellar motor protein MotB n=1 Tax=Flaviaesturariibacter flavus TaxID=2502780 RepID=A0A4R1B9A2_9BACT|nr:OmpA family protein [Flaviaesturariibacter flavus]TCJ13389.1 flagellar motor protein MotB [Flaviaesturariibacter flavus]